MFFNTDKNKVSNKYPLEITSEIFLNGFNSSTSYQADSYFIKSSEGNWLIDSPRFETILEKIFQKMGGIKYIFLTHRDHVGDANQFAKAFGAKRIIHEYGSSVCPNAEVILQSNQNTSLGKAKIIFTPGHTQDHCVLLWNQKFLFTGDHLSWSAKDGGLRSFRKFCWYSWSEQIKSVQKLEFLKEVEWVLPGHGDRVHIDKGQFPNLIHESVTWMQKKN